MNDQKWENLTKMVEAKFGIEEDYGEEIPEEEGGGTIDVVIVNVPIGKIKLERYNRPIVLSKKTTYSKRGGSETNVEYVHSDTEFAQSLKVYKLDELNDNWEELSVGNFENILG